MTKQEEFKPRVPSIRELVRWHNQFGRMLEPNKKGTKLFGVDGKEVKFIKRSMPEITNFVNILGGERFRDITDDRNGYSNVTRGEDSISLYRLEDPDRNGGWVFLNDAECDLVLGSNYYVIDRGYSSPGPQIRKMLFRANKYVGDYYNAFELGVSVGGYDVDDETLSVPIIYYKIPQQRFRELRDWHTNLDGLVKAVRAERKIKSSFSSIS